jgi:anti-sigma factor RsiW
MAAPLSCDQYEELLGDYLLYALEPEAVSTVTEHLSTCDRCRTQGTAYEAVLDQLAQAVPQQEPPTELGARVLTAAVAGTMLAASVPEALRPARRPTWRPR